jgi:excisionase family DNA binding protein
VTEERLLSAKDVAELLNVSQRMVQKIAQQGELAPVRIGDLLRFRPTDVKNYI